MTPVRVGPIAEARRLVTLAWPVILAQLGMVLMGAVDLWMVAPLGEAATGALGLGNTYSFALVILALGTATGVDPLVTQAYGANQPRRAGLAALQGMLVVGGLGVPIMALHTVAPTVLGALQQPPNLLPLADAYCTINALGIAPLLAFAVMRQWLQGDGVMLPGMLAIGVANVANVVGNAWLIEPYGVAGVAWSTVIVRWLALFVLIAISHRPLRRSWPDAPVLDPTALVRLTTIAFPVGVQVGLEVWAFSSAALLAGSLGTTAVAAHVSALNVVALAFMMANGLSAAAATRVGNLVGAGQPWPTAATMALGLVVGFMSVTGLVFFTFPETIGRVYASDPEVVALIAAVLPVGAAFGLFDGLQVVAFGILRGLGDTRVPSTFNLIGYWMLGLPLGALLANTSLGLVGVWVGLAVALVIVAGLLGLRIRWHANMDRNSRSADRISIIEAKPMQPSVAAQNQESSP
ncbi:MAG: MATE family efflux transporter [Myxococcota bacterium]